MKKTFCHEFTGSVVFFGFGAVAECTIPLLLDRIKLDLKKIVIIDRIKSEAVEKYERLGIRFFCLDINESNVFSILKEHLKSGDLLIDLAYCIDCCDLLRWCHDSDVLYINTSVELWDPYKDKDSKQSKELTLYPRHMAIKDLREKWGEVGPTMVIEHGANPGLVSHFTKRALTDIANELLKKNSEDFRKEEIELLLREGRYPELAKLLDIRVIHISERDSQISLQPYKEDEFVNTWSVEGFYEEGTAPAEMGWGTHEKELPLNSSFYNYGPKNQICLDQMGIQTWARSMVPSGPLVGMIVRHGESFTISDYLTVWKNNDPKEGVEYRPTVHYVYCPSEATLKSLDELKKQGLQMPEKKRIMRNEILSGSDEVGVLLMGHALKSWWTGSVLSIDEARILAPNQNATTLQVAASVLAATIWMMRNPNRGICVSDELPHEEILDLAMPYLGSLVSRAIDWSPLEDDNSPLDCDTSDPWQFKNFRLPL